MPLNEDGSDHENYCRWCYADGDFADQSKDALLDFLTAHMPNPEHAAEDVRRMQFDTYLAQLKHWK